MLDGHRYSHRWQQKRAHYFAAGWAERLVTTDDLNGLLSGNLEKVIDDICAGIVIDTPTNKFSHHHYRLGGAN